LPSRPGILNILGSVVSIAGPQHSLSVVFVAGIGEEARRWRRRDVSETAEAATDKEEDDGCRDTFCIALVIYTSYYAWIDCDSLPLSVFCPRGWVMTVS